VFWSIPAKIPNHSPSGHEITSIEDGFWRQFMRTIDLDLWADGAAEKLPKITITPQGLRFEGREPEFDRLCLILGGWLKQ